jgi:hypothetical protein
MLFNRSVPGGELLVVFKFSIPPLPFNKTQPSGKMDRNCEVFANGCSEMLLKVIGQPLGTAKRV